jgi:hypothetical protein
LKRIEEDRERHKRLKEDAWLISHSTNADLVDLEFERAWDMATTNATTLTELDWESIQHEHILFLEASPGE